MFAVLTTNLINLTRYNWEHEFSLNESAIDTERLHHTLISIIQLEAALVYVWISLLWRYFGSVQELHFLTRLLRFGLVTLLDASTLFVHALIVNEKSSAQYSIRLDAIFLMCLNLLLMAYIP